MVDDGDALEGGQRREPQLEPVRDGNEAGLRRLEARGGEDAVPQGAEGVEDLVADGVVYAEVRYAQRYRTPKPNPQRVVIEVIVKRVLGSSTLLDRS